ncbi:hypothetical protein BD414DRAFT_515805 [Trametes punicea]|nr:hypothetical protein BD414DRAFT_515805 [Trametes punicea]
MAQKITRTQPSKHIEDDSAPWFPWPDRETCVLDILRHLPRCAFSRRQNAAISWALHALGVKDIPSEYTLLQVNKSLQKLCGVSSIRYKGAMGHVYYMNDLAAIIAQEFANPQVRPHLHFYPEDAGTVLAEAWQAARWCEELDPNLAAPMVRIGNQDYFVYEPAQLQDGRVCMPFRWFVRGREMFARVWSMVPTTDLSGWVVLEHQPFEISARELIAALPMLRETASYYRVPDPRYIIGVQKLDNGGIYPWTLTDPNEGNCWRKRARGHRVIAFPIWLYCDDTSGNLSKKWNKHNSFLFTAAGLPRRYVHKEGSIHFLCTSNAAPPLEMLDGIVDQLRDMQDSGIWAWDCLRREIILVVPSVLAMLGDNPMQSEIACHVGLAGKLFCRVCNVSKACSSSNDDSEDDSDSVLSGSDAFSAAGLRYGASETMADMIDRIQRFMSIGVLRNRKDTLRELQSQFTSAQEVGGQAFVKRSRTRSGIRDAFQSFFVDRLFSLTTRTGRTRQEREADVADYVRTIPRYEEAATSPVWRIRDFDPHSDTPVEILHVILLGFVKYLWRDTVSRLKDSAKETLVARLTSFDVAGLGIPPLQGTTLVNYAKSLVGRDFRAIAQAAPFVLHDLCGIPDELHGVWIALSRLIPLVWQPTIMDFPTYKDALQSAIDYFLEATCKLTPRWFNKPKFHLILHLPEHIRRFGPAMLFATEGFESFNAVIRSHSIHSNHGAPSHDIAIGMAHHHRIRHLLSGGLFIAASDLDALEENVSTSRPDHPRSPWLSRLAGSVDSIDHLRWCSIGPNVAKLLDADESKSDILGLLRVEITLAGRHGLTFPLRSTQSRPVCRTATKVLLHDDEWYRSDGKAWVLYKPTRCADQSSLSEHLHPGRSHLAIGKLWETIQLVGSDHEAERRADFLLVQEAIFGDTHQYYKMPQIDLTSDYVLVSPDDVICTVNVQHDCYSLKCALTETRVLRYEREDTSERTYEISHALASKYVLNIAQMRNSALLMPPANFSSTCCHARDRVKVATPTFHNPGGRAADMADFKGPSFKLFLTCTN